MFIVLAYDIPDDRRRTRLFKALKRFGSSVQESVFEFHLKPNEIVHLRRAIEKVIDEQTDQVRCYFLCPTCHERTTMTFPSVRTANPCAVIV